MRYYIIIFFWLAINIFAQTFTGFAPLKVGNSWTYVENYSGTKPEYEKHTVIDSNVTIGGYSFFEIETVTQSYSGRSYYQVFGNFYAKYDTTYLDSLYRYYPLEAKVDFEWNLYDKDSNIVRNVIDDSTNTRVFGKETTTYYLIRESALLGSGEYWTKEFGRLYSIEEFAEYSLVGCVIDGIVYGDTTIVSIFNEVDLPQDFVLNQNYPNPFNPTTLIKYQMPTASYVQIKLYNMLGQEVKELVNKSQQAGYHEISFDGSDLPSGMYIYKITAENFTDSKKMLLLK